MKKALVIGLGISGLASSEFLLQKGYNVVGVDARNISTHLPIQFCLEKEYKPDPYLNLVVLSPGISRNHPILCQLQKDIPIFGEISLAANFIQQPMIGITGTNGKTTVTSMITHVLNYCGIAAEAVGNIGTPLIQCVSRQNQKILVVELSSFQLETLRSKSFSLGVILNITPDHLSRYNGFLDYVKTKLNLQNCIKEGGRLYLSQDIKNRFSSLLDVNHLEFPIDPWLEIPRFFVANLAAAFAICSHFSISREKFSEAISFFKPHKHRLEFIRELNQIHFYNDSKATNIDAVRMAVTSLRKNIWLLSGGCSKGTSFACWSWQLKPWVRGIYVFGSCTEQIVFELSHSLPVISTANLQEATVQAYCNASPGDVVLLSPGCSSFDEFQNYEDRGNVFKKIVGELV